jgi:ubiquitin-like-conjugating enzyme ATG3
MEYNTEQEKVLDDEGDEDGGWVDTHHYEPSINQKVQDMTIEPSKKGQSKSPAKSSSKPQQTPVEDDDEEVALDMVIGSI